MPEHRRRRRSRRRKPRKLPWIAAIVASLAVTGGTVAYVSARNSSGTYQPAKSNAKRETGTYLGDETDKIALRVLPPPTTPAEEEADRLAFEKTRALKGSARWKLAAHDAKITTKSLLTSFSCAAGVELDRDRLPQLSSVLSIAEEDAVRVANKAKDKYQRTRPYIAFGGPTCKAPGKLKDEGDYPSGHSARGWTFGLILAALLPERAQQLRERADDYAQSRLICGFHTKSGIDGGKSVALLTLTALKKNDDFRNDLQNAAEELASFKKEAQPLPAEVCAWEQHILDKEE